MKIYVGTHDYWPRCRQRERKMGPCVPKSGFYGPLFFFSGDNPYGSCSPVIFFRLGIPFRTDWNPAIGRLAFSACVCADRMLGSRFCQFAGCMFDGFGKKKSKG